MSQIKRTPFYSQDRHQRVISAPNGMWVPQKFLGGAGKNKTTGRDSQPHYDPWVDIHMPVSDRQRAIATINPRAAEGK